MTRLLFGLVPWAWTVVPLFLLSCVSALAADKEKTDKETILGTWYGVVLSAISSQFAMSGQHWA
jgi:hypothetical protein